MIVNCIGQYFQQVICNSHKDDIIDRHLLSVCIKNYSLYKLFLYNEHLSIKALYNYFLTTVYRNKSMERRASMSIIFELQEW